MTTSLSDQIEAYTAMRDQLERDHLGQWVVFYGEELVGAYDDFQLAAESAVQRFGRGPYLIRRVGEPPPRLPTSVLYGNL